MIGYITAGLLGVSLGAIVTPLTTTDPAPLPYAERYPAAVDERPTQNVAALDAHSVALAERQVEVKAAKVAQAERERQARVEASRLAQVAAEQEKQAEAKRVAQAQKATPAARQFNAPAKAKPARGQRFEATAYTAFCNTGCTGVTATGLDVSNTIYAPSGRRVIAADPAVLPLGSVVTVSLSNGVAFEAEVADVGGAIRGNRIDILTASKAEAVRFGRQAVTITR